MTMTLSDKNVLAKSRTKFLLAQAKRVRFWKEFAKKHPKKETQNGPQRTSIA